MEDEEEKEKKKSRDFKDFTNEYFEKYKDEARERAKKFIDQSLKSAEIQKIMEKVAAEVKQRQLQVAQQQRDFLAYLEAKDEYAKLWIKRKNLELRQVELEEQVGEEETVLSAKAVKLRREWYHLEQVRQKVLTKIEMGMILSILLDDVSKMIQPIFGFHGSFGPCEVPAGMGKSKQEPVFDVYFFAWSEELNDAVQTAVVRDIRKKEHQKLTSHNVEPW